MSSARLFCVIAAIVLGSGVALGAFGAHALPDFLQKKYADKLKDESASEARVMIEKKIDNFEKGVRYQLYHGFALLILNSFIFTSITHKAKDLKTAAETSPPTAFYAANILFLFGILLFSGGLYAITITDLKVHLIIPFGGLAFLVGWCLVAIGYARWAA
jgi:uncharacterized membrane protein YgdD (TMEM256/DUF423 family)